MDEDSGSGGGGGAAAATTGTRLTHEQAEAAHAPLDTPLCIIAAAGTGKTTTMLERVRYMVDQVRRSPGEQPHLLPHQLKWSVGHGLGAALSPACPPLTCSSSPCGLALTLLQGVPAEEILVLTFSRRAAAEFRGRLLRARVPSADAVEVSTFHSWCALDSVHAHSQPAHHHGCGIGCRWCCRCPDHAPASPPRRSWAVLRRHWREAGFERPPSVAASEEQLLGVMRDCVM